MESKSHKLYLILEDCDNGGYNILKVLSSVDECEEFLDANPIQQTDAIVARAEAGVDPVYFDLIPSTYIMVMNDQVVSSPIAAEFIEEELKKKAEGSTTHQITRVNRLIFLHMSREGTVDQCIKCVPRTVKVALEPIK